MFLTSCAPVITSINPETLFIGFDFRKYTEKGFLFTPEKYSGVYESIGTVRYVHVPGAKLTEYLKRSNYDGTNTMQKKWVIDSASVSHGIDSLFSLASSMGANAIMNFVVIPATRTHSVDTMGIVTIEGYDISGFAIRRKEN